jgi:hypothetical protein
VQRGFVSQVRVTSKLEVAAQPGTVYEGYVHLSSCRLLAFGFTPISSFCHPEGLSVIMGIHLTYFRM